MLARISSYHLRTALITYNNKVYYSIFRSFFISSASISTPPDKPSTTYFNSHSANLSRVGKNLFSNKKDIDFCVTSASVNANKLLRRIAHVSPETARKYLNLCTWKPENVCEFLLDFELGCRKSGFVADAETTECLFEFFWRLDGSNYESFKHLPKSFDVMAAMLLNVGMFREVELLLSVAEYRGISLASDEIYSGLIEGYMSAGELERAVLIYDKVKGRHLVLSLSGYRSIIGVLIKVRKFTCVVSVYEEAVGAGFIFGDDETRNLETLIGFLCSGGKTMEARKLLRKIVDTGWKPSRVILSQIANVYCEKRDFEDVLNFFTEMKCAPDILIGNRVIHLLCSHFGIGRADLLLWELEQLGFSPNEVTFGILIGFCSRDGRLRDAFCYMSDIFTRGLKPNRHSYNALISSIFKVGMVEHVRDVFSDMVDNGIHPDMATYRALLAGYFRARQFNEVKLLVNEMRNYGLLHLSPLEDPFCKAFFVLGLDPLTVKVKRDNDLKFFRAEFVDDLGNGLYLDTNLHVFEKTISSVLEESLVPDFNLLVSRLCDDRNAKEVVLMIDEMAEWGQELLPSVFSTLVRLLSNSDLLDQILIRMFGRYGRPEIATNLLDQILMARTVPETSSYDCTVQRFCNYNNLNCAMQFLAEMLRRKCKPSLDTWDLIIEKFCLQRRATGAEELLTSMVNVGQTPTKKMYLSVINSYHNENNTTKASELLNRMQQHGYKPDFTTQWSLISSLSNSGDHHGSHQGFLSRLLGGSGFFAQGCPKIQN